MTSAEKVRKFREEKKAQGMKRVEVWIHESTYNELTDLLKNDLEEYKTISEIGTWLLTCAGEGWRRPGSWERNMMSMTGLLPKGID